MDDATDGEELSMKSVMALLKAMRSKDISMSVHTVYVPTGPTTSRASTEADPARSQDTAIPYGYRDVSEEVHGWPAVSAVLLPYLSPWMMTQPQVKKGSFQLIAKGG